MDTLTGLWNFFIEEVLSLLPLSPFREYLDYFEGLEYIGYLNWFFPFREILIVFEGWLGVVASYYIVSTGARWLKVIGD